MIFHKKLLGWFLDHRRPFPWRDNNNPYNVWLSEIILQQTRANQGLPYYQRFVNTYPKIDYLAKAGQEDILKLWEGLGYYSRAINLHSTAKQIVKDYEGRFPKDFEEIKKLKGIGDYTRIEGLGKNMIPTSRNWINAFERDQHKDPLQF